MLGHPFRPPNSYIYKWRLAGCSKSSPFAIVMDISSLFETFSADCHAAFLEFVGTVVFLLLGLGGIQAAAGESASDATPASTVQQVLYVSTCMGLSLLVSAWLFFRVTGGVFNPNVSLALLLVGAIGPVRFVLFCIAQLLGGIAAAGLVLALTPGPLASKYVVLRRFVTIFSSSYAAHSCKKASMQLRAFSLKCSSQRRW
jgi:glycerol uptake facilitator-like aquaporin